MSNKVAIICPTYNAGGSWMSWNKALTNQSRTPDKTLVIDSGSGDGTKAIASKFDLELIEISSAEFNHGGTRNLAVSYLDGIYDILIFLTQDAIMVDDNSIQSIIAPFNDGKIGAVCGRQLPHPNANVIEAHARLFNYPNESSIKTQQDISKLGIKTAFMSNSFAAYRYTAFVECGGFPADTIFAEDMSLAAKMILSDWKIAYESKAQVFHSHGYTIKQEFKRYFDVGVFYKREGWIKQSFGHASGEGLKFVKSEIKFLIQSKKYLFIIEALIRTMAKFIAFKIGSFEHLIPASIKKNISMNKKYWHD